jgi:hypothetical protein
MFRKGTIYLFRVLFNTFAITNPLPAALPQKLPSGFLSPGSDNVDVVYVGTEVWGSPVVACDPPCIFVFPTKSLPTPTTIAPINYTTSVEYGGLGTTELPNGQTVSVFVTTTPPSRLSFPK